MHLDLAHRFLTAPQGSDERALAGAELSASLACERGWSRQEMGGDVAEVRAGYASGKRRQAARSNLWRAHASQPDARRILPPLSYF